MEYKGLSSSQFADGVEVPRAVISHILSGRNKPSLEVVTKIVAAFPDVSIRWMLLGEGDMLKPLAAAIAPDLKATDAKPAQLTTVDQTTEQPGETGKVQNVANSHAAPEKTIEQIVVFYSDKTFIAYKP